MAIKKLSPEEIRNGLDQLEGWTLKNGKLHKDYTFPDFVQAFGFMTSLAIVAEAMGHHPEWSNVYNRVAIDLTTHDAGGISKHDFELARRADEIA